MFHYGHQRKRARTATGSRQLSLGSASPPLPGMPDAGEPASKAASLLNGCSGKYSRYAKADSRHYKRAEDLCGNWLGKQYSHQQTAEVFERCLVEATRLLDMYDFDDPDAQAVVVLQHPAEQLRTVQQLLITRVSIAMMAPREPVVESFKLSWLNRTI